SEEDEESPCEEDDPTPHKKKHSKKDKKNKKRSKKHSKKAKQAVSSEKDEDSACEDDDPNFHKKKHSKKDKSKSKKSKAKETVESPEEDEESGSEEDVAWAKYDDMRGKFRRTVDEAPSKKDIIWKVCAFDKAHMYATNYCLGGYYLFKKYKTDTIVALLWKMPSKDDTAYCREKYFLEEHKQVLLNMGYTVDELPLDYKPYLHGDLAKTRKHHKQHHAEDDVASEDESASEDDDLTPYKKKHSKNDSKKVKKNKSKKSKVQEIVESSEEDEHESTCEEDEESLKMSPTVMDITSALNVPSPKDAQWAMHASNEDV
ncbi:hypothetical protein BG000_005242, partial [Podila horticola]